MKFVAAILAAALGLSLPNCRKPAPEPPPPPAATPEPTPSPTPQPTPTPPPAANKSAGVIILCYHRFEEKPRDGMAIKPSEFESQLLALKDNGFEVVGMQDFLAWRRGEKAIPERSAVITIDDGYRSAYEVGWPLLKKFGYPFTMFIYTNYVKGQPNAGGQSLSWEELAEMRDAGVDIQNHSKSHANLRTKKGDYAAFLREELVASKQMLEQQLGVLVNCFAYPYGIHSDDVRKATMEAGYEAAFSVYGQRITHTSPADQLGRYAVDATDPKIFAAAIKMTGGGTSAAYAGTGGAAAPAAISMVTRPMDGETITEPSPEISADLATLGEIDPATLEMRISGFGIVPAAFDAASKTLSYQVTRKLAPQTYTVLVSATAGGKKVQTRWSFQVGGPGAAAK